MPEPPCPMQISFSGARKEEFSLPFLVFRLIFAFWLLGSEDQFPLLYRRDVLQQVFLFYSCYNMYIGDKY